MTYLERHTLYYRKSCRSCQNVLSLMDQHGIRMRTCDVSHPNHLKNLITLTGHRTVPCLVTPGRVIHGEDEIIREIRTEAFAPKTRPVRPREEEDGR